MANIRAAYAEVSTDALTNTDSNVDSLYVTATQTQDNWQKSDTTDIGGVQVGTASTAGTKKGWIIAYNSTNSKVTITPAESKPEGALDYPSKS